MEPPLEEDPGSEDVWREEEELSQEEVNTERKVKRPTAESSSSTSDSDSQWKDDEELSEYQSDEEDDKGGTKEMIPPDQDFPKEWEKHHITDFSLAQRDYFCFGLYNYLPRVSKWLGAAWSAVLGLFFTKDFARRDPDAGLLPFIAPAFLEAFHWSYRMALVTLFGSILCFVSESANYIGRMSYRATRKITNSSKQPGCFCQ